MIITNIIISVSIWLRAQKSLILLFKAAFLESVTNTLF